MIHAAELILFVISIASVNCVLFHDDLCSCGCPVDWVNYDGRCFKYESTEMDWLSAELHCLSQGANLVSIRSDAENNFVQDYVKGFNSYNYVPTWIGLSACHQRNKWLWSDGTRLTYTKWNPLEPSLSLDEHCVHMNWPSISTSEYNWNDISCQNKYSFVCAKNKEEQKNSQTYDYIDEL